MHLIGFAFTDRALDFLAGVPPKIRRQIVKKAKSLHTTPFPPTSKKLHDVTTPEGYSVYRERSGDYRILYIVRNKPAEVLVLDIGYRKEIYQVAKTKTEPADDMRMKEGQFDDIMRGALGVPAPLGKHKADPKPEPETKRLSAYPAKRRR